MKHLIIAIMFLVPVMASCQKVEKKKPYSVSILFSRHLPDGNTEMALRCVTIYAISKDEAFGIIYNELMDTEFKKKDSQDFKLVMHVTYEIKLAALKK